MIRISLVHLIKLNSLIFNIIYNWIIHAVHLCGAGGNKRACHAEGSGSIPGQAKFSGWGFFGVFLTCETNVRKL